MIRDMKLDGLVTEEWNWYFEEEQDAQTWIWNQLMGETAKGDSLEFVKIYRDEEIVSAGILRDATGKLKGIVPAIYENDEKDVAKILYYNGQLQRYWLSDQKPDDKDEEQTDLQVDLIVREFLGR